MPINYDPVDGYIAGIAANSSAPNYLQVTADFSQAAWNTVATHVLALISGIVRCRMWFYIVGQPASENDTATLRLLTTGEVLSGAVAIGDDIPANSVYKTGDVYTNIGNSTDVIFDKILVNGNVAYTVGIEALTGGSLRYNCVWEPMTPGATVTAGTGGAP